MLLMDFKVIFSFFFFTKLYSNLHFIGWKSRTWEKFHEFESWNVGNPRKSGVWRIFIHLVVGDFWDGWLHGFLFRRMISSRYRLTPQNHSYTKCDEWTGAMLNDRPGFRCWSSSFYKHFNCQPVPLGSSDTHVYYFRFDWTPVCVATCCPPADNWDWPMHASTIWTREFGPATTRTCVRATRTTGRLFSWDLLSLNITTYFHYSPVEGISIVDSQTILVGPSAIPTWVYEEHS